MAATSHTNQQFELLQQIESVSELRERLERAVRTLAERQGEPSAAVDSARTLEGAVRELKRELVRNYLECRIVEAAQAMEAAAC